MYKKSWASVYMRLRMFTRKADVFRMNSGDNKNRRRYTVLTLHSKFRKKDFLHKIITDHEKWIFYDNLNVENHGLILVNLQYQRQSTIFTSTKFCSVSGGFVKVCYITSCYNRVKQSRQTAINNNWPIWAMH